MLFHFLPRRFRLAAPGLAFGLAVLLCAPDSGEAGEIEAQLSFSVDGGKTFSPDSPVVASGGSLQVRADWEIHEDSHAIAQNMVVFTVRDEKEDFASADRGAQTWSGAPAWYQQYPHFLHADHDQTAILTLQFHARQAGTLGESNQWDKASGKFVNGPLPAIAALGMGTHSFVAKLTYNLDGSGTAVDKEIPFQVTITNAAPPPAGAAAPAAAMGTGDAMPLPVLAGDKVWPVETWKVLAGGGALKTGAVLVRPAGAQEIGFRVDGISDGNYFLRVLVDTGAGNGEDELNQAKPFLFVNGQPIHFLRGMPLAPLDGGWVTVIESADPVPLRNGDEIRWNLDRAGRGVGGVAVASQALSPAPIDVVSFYDPELHDVFRLDGKLSGGAAAGDAGNFSLDVNNVSGAAGNFQVKVEVRDFWNRLLASKDASVSMENRVPWHLDLPFPSPQSDRCRAIVTVQGPGGAERKKVFEQLLDGPRGVRPRLWLNQGWEWASIPDDGTPATRTLGDYSGAAKVAKWDNVDLPASWIDSRPKDPIAWYRRQIELPPWLAGKTLILHFSRIIYEGKIFLNGQEIASHFGQPGQFDVDLTGKLRPGSNELLLEVRGAIAAFVPSELAAPQIEISARSQLRAPEPQTAGVGEVWIDGAGAAPLGDVFVRSSFRRKEVAVDVETPPLPPGTSAVLKNHIYFEGKEVLSLPDTPVSGAGTSHVTAAWADPILWNPGDPCLLQLVTELDGADGSPIDRKETRFGFREFWADEKNLVWNGTPVKLVGIPFISGWGWELTRRSKRDALRDSLLLIKRMGGTLQRHVYDPEDHAEIADEEGIVMAQGAGGVVSPTVQKVGSDEFWSNAARFDTELVRGLRNHPSIVEWYLSNEFFASDDEPNRKRLEELARTVRPLDDSRIIEFGCDLDLSGVSEVMSTHYPVDVRALRDEKAFLPEGVYWRPLNAVFQVGDRVPDGIIHNVANIRHDSPITWGKKPIIINETLWDYFLNPPDGLTRLVGELPYRSPTSLERSLQAAETWFVRGDRDAEAAVVTPWVWIQRDTIRVSVPPADINPIQRYQALFGGKHVDFDVNLHWDVPRAASLDWKWSLLQDGHSLAGGGTPGYAFSSSELKRERISIDLPSVSVRTECRLVMELWEGDKLWQRRELPLVLYPPASLSLPSGTRAAIYDPSGKTAQALADLLPGLEAVPALTDEALAGIDLLLVGEDAAVADNPAGRDALRRYVTQGGRLFVLAQNLSPRLLPLPLVCTQLVSSQLWSFRSENPLLTGTGDDALAYWYPDHVVARNLYLKPEGGGWRTWLESGGPNGLVYAAVLERALGKGVVFCSQLSVTGALGNAPGAALILGNELRRLAPPPAAPPQLGFLGDADGALHKTLEQMGVRLDLLASPAAAKGGEAILVDGAQSLSADAVAALQDFATRGGRLWIHGVTPANQAQVAAVLGGPVALYGNSPKAWAGRAIKIAADPAISGLTDYDLFWKRRLYNTTTTPFYDPAMILDSLGDWALQPEKGTVLLYPGYLAEAPAGKGSVLLDNLHWERQGLTTRANARRIASVLLTNFGAEFQPEKMLAIPEGLSYAPVDLSSVLNRAFADDVAEDGKGGWTDQGPDADLRNFPLEPAVRNFQGVPFRIGNPLGVLTLASAHGKAGPPESAELPVTGRADALFFLQSSAWTGPHHNASYVVHYTDGTDYEIKLLGDVNERDWAAPNPDDPFPYETDTITRAAWTGTSKANPKVSLYWMAWPNPHPDVPLRGVTFLSTKEAIPLLVAVTVGTKGAASADGGTKATAADPARAQSELNAARAAAGGGDAVGARRHFQAAVRAAPHSPDAYLDWASWEESSGNKPAAIPVYEALLREIPDNLEALFRLGKAYEDAKQWDKAAEIYQRSLNINPNQFDVLRALNDVQKKQNP